MNGPPESYSVYPVSWSEARLALESVRRSVFVEEQGIDAREEFDSLDVGCEHFLAGAASGLPIGTARLETNGKIGRIAVLATWRRRGVGRALLHKAIDTALRSGLKRVYLHAQVSAIGFYERAGFVSVGEDFMESGIAHRRMERCW